MKIILNYFKSSKLNQEFDNVTSIVTEKTPFARGGFGEIYFCTEINNKPNQAQQVIKILIDNGTGSDTRSFETLVRLQEEIIKYNIKLKQNNQKSLEEINALWALPQFSFKGTINGKSVIGYSANYLDKNWYEFDNIFNHANQSFRKQLRNSFYNLTIDHRLKMAHDLAEGFTHLGNMNFIYADLNPQNFFVNQKEGKLCLIDYEGGAVNDAPETYGKPGEWLAPEIQEQLRIGKSFITVDLNTDTWAVAIAIHFILFPFHPLFFLKVRGRNEMSEYLNNYQYPNIDTSHQNFRELATYNWYLKSLKNSIPGSVVKAFADTINNGYNNRNKRLSYKQWMRALKDLMHPPVISGFSSSSNIILKGTSVNLSWQIDGTIGKLTLNNGIGDITGKTSLQVSPTVSSVYILTAENSFGRVTEELKVSVLPKPVIKSFSVSSPVIAFGSEVGLSWEVKDAESVTLVIDQKKQSVQNKGTLLIKPEKDVNCVLYAKAFDGTTVITKSLSLKVFKRTSINSFLADHHYIIQSLPVNLTWDVENASTITLSSTLGKDEDVTGKKAIQVLPLRSMTYTLSAKNDLFSDLKNIVIEVQPLPALPRLDVIYPKGGISLPKIDLLIADTAKSIEEEIQSDFERVVKSKRAFKFLSVFKIR